MDDQFWLYDVLWAVTEARLLARAARCDRMTFDHVIRGRDPWLEARVPFSTVEVTCAVPERLMTELAGAFTSDMPGATGDRPLASRLMRELAAIVCEQWFACVSGGAAATTGTPKVNRVSSPELDDGTYFPALFRGNPVVLRILDAERM
jgi:hypothetical protein